jgi:hypothetical protein
MNDRYANVPPDVLEEVRKQEKDRVASADGMLGGLTSAEERVKPKPDPPKRVTDIRSGHGYT